MSCSSRPSPASVGRVAIEAKLTLRQLLRSLQCFEEGKLGHIFFRYISDTPNHIKLLSAFKKKIQNK